MTDPSSDGIGDAIEEAPAEAAHMKARSGLMIAIRETLIVWNVAHPGRGREAPRGSLAASQ
jgi:predicted XRE-type DNA-binding protein